MGVSPYGTGVDDDKERALSCRTTAVYTHGEGGGVVRKKSKRHRQTPCRHARRLMERFFGNIFFSDVKLRKRGKKVSFLLRKKQSQPCDLKRRVWRTIPVDVPQGVRIFFSARKTLFLEIFHNLSKLEIFFRSSTFFSEWICL